LVTGLATLVAYPSAVGAGALVVLAGVGIALEVTVWRHFRRRWAGETTSHPMDIPQPLREPVAVVAACGLLAGALIWKAVGLGYPWTTGLVSGLVLFVIYAVAWLVDRSVRR